MRPKTKYTPFQRLDFVYKISDEMIYVRAKLIVPLHADESIESPYVVQTEGFYSEETLFVRGKDTGSEKLFPVEYLIEFLPFNDVKKPASDFTQADIAILKAALKESLVGRPYVVKTLITKNPTEDVTNTISEDGDIDPRD